MNDATAITAYFYLRIVVLMYFSPPRPAVDADGLQRGEPFVVVPGVLTGIVVGVSTAVTLVLGIAPSWFLDALQVPWPLLS